MKILVINGSPKGERSDTMKVTRAFLEGMGETYDYIDTMRVNVKPCLGCYACWFQTPGKCVQNDDMPGAPPKPSRSPKATAASKTTWSCRPSGR